MMVKIEKVEGGYLLTDDARQKYVYKDLTEAFDKIDDLLTGPDITRPVQPEALQEDKKS